MISLYQAWLRASHQASGVPRTSRTTVVTAASRMVSPMISHMNGSNMGSPLRVRSGPGNSITIALDDGDGLGTAQEAQEDVGNLIGLALLQQDGILDDGSIKIVRHDPARALL